MDLGDNGLLHISDISCRITHPSEFFALGDSIEVIVLKYDSEQGRVTLGYKQKASLALQKKNTRSIVVKGKVVSITGADVCGTGGVLKACALELDWSPRPKHPSKYITIGETIEAVVLKLDRRRRLSLGKTDKAEPGCLF